MHKATSLPPPPVCDGLRHWPDGAPLTGSSSGSTTVAGAPSSNDAGAGAGAGLASLRKPASPGEHCRYSPSRLLAAPMNQVPGERCATLGMGGVAGAARWRSKKAQNRSAARGGCSGCGCVLTTVVAVA